MGTQIHVCTPLGASLSLNHLLYFFLAFGIVQFFCQSHSAYNIYSCLYHKVPSPGPLKIGVWASNYFIRKLPLYCLSLLLLWDCFKCLAKLENLAMGNLCFSFFLAKNIHQMLGNSCSHTCSRVYSYVLCKSVKDLL